LKACGFHAIVAAAYVEIFRIDLHLGMINCSWYTARVLIC